MSDSSQPVKTPYCPSPEENAYLSMFFEQWWTTNKEAGTINWAMKEDHRKAFLSGWFAARLSGPAEFASMELPESTEEKTEVKLIIQKFFGRPLTLPEKERLSEFIDRSAANQPTK